MIANNPFERNVRSSPFTYSDFQRNGAGRSQTITEEEIELAKEEEIQRQNREKREGTDGDDFILKYMRVRSGGNGVVKNAQLTDNEKDQHILSNADSAEVENKESAQESGSLDHILADAIAGVEVPILSDLLSPEELAELKGRYDPLNMGFDQIRALGEELYQLGVISREEADAFGFVKVAAGSSGFLTGPGMDPPSAAYLTYRTAQERMHQAADGGNYIDFLYQKLDFYRSQIGLLNNAEPGAQFGGDRAQGLATMNQAVEDTQRAIGILWQLLS